MERHSAALGLGWVSVWDWEWGFGMGLGDRDIPVSSVRCTVKMAIKSARLFNKC